MNRLRKTFHGNVGGGGGGGSVRKSQKSSSAAERAWPDNDDPMNMNERRRPSGRRGGDRNNASGGGGGGGSPPPSRIGRERRSRRGGGGGGEGNASAKDGAHRSSGGRKSGGARHALAAEEPPSGRRRRRPPQDPPASREQRGEQPRRSNQHRQHPPPNGGGTPNNDEDDDLKLGRRRSKKEIYSSVTAAIDALDTFKTTYKPPLSASRIKHKKMGAAATATSANESANFADFSNFDAFHAMTKNETVPSSFELPPPKSDRRSSAPSNGNPNSRQRRSSVGGHGSAVAGQSGHRPPGGKVRTAKNNHPSNVPSPQHHHQQQRHRREYEPSSLDLPPGMRTGGGSPHIVGKNLDEAFAAPPQLALDTSPTKGGGRRRDGDNGNEESALSSAADRCLADAVRTKSPSRRGKESSTSSSSPGKARSPRRTKAKGDPPSPSKKSKRSKSKSDTSSSGIPPRLRNDLQTRRRRALDVQCLYHEDGSVECDVPGLGDVDPTAVYRCKLSPHLNASEEEEGKHDEKDGGEGGNRRRPAGSDLGRNGWHRALETLAPRPPPSAVERLRTIKSGSSYGSTEASGATVAAAPLDQMTATHILQSVHPQLDELDAIEEEYDYLLKEIRSLEKDRVQLEQRFHDAGRACTREKLKEKLTYQTFRTNLRYMKCEDMRALPVTWLEDVPLSMPDDDTGQNGNNNRKLYAKLDKDFQDKIRNHRGSGLALLIADQQCKTSLIGRCYMNSNMSAEAAYQKPAMLRREKAATLIDEGGEWLRQCAITGFDNAGDLNCIGGDEDHSAWGTTYFLKFDNGRTHHRGDLPLNLVARLHREKKEPESIKYLSTGCSYDAAGRGAASLRGHRCYYAEFDNGECWWGTNKDDVLDKVFMEMDVHRVAFGNSGGGGSGRSSGVDRTSEDTSSWMVLGKDGAVRWKNVPQGLHDALVERELAAAALGSDYDAAAAIRGPASAPCEVSLGIGGTYFVRFLDGRVDYSLPNFVADVFDKFEADGKSIRDVALHVDTYDCLIRYSREKGSDDGEIEGGGG